MSFDYEKSVWGRGTAGIQISDPSSIRLRNALKAIQELPAGSKVLEIGCGAGQFIRAIKKLRPELLCYGSDISYSAIQLAKQAGDGVKYFFHEGDKLPFAANWFDAVIFLDVLEHVEDPGFLLKQINSVLKPNGILYAFVPCEGDGLSFWNLLRKMGIGAELTKKYAGHIQYFSRRNLQQLLQTNGFQVVRQKYSEHLVGQFLGVFAFTAMNISSKKAEEQVNNEAYFAAKNNKMVIILKNIINSIVSVESVLLSLFPSPNVHVFARKNQLK